MQNEQISWCASSSPNEEVDGHVRGKLVLTVTKKSREQPPQPEKRVRLHREERRALILQIAKRVFTRSTYAEANVGELARESEVTEPMLYKHFGSKKGLFLAVLCEFGQQSLDLLRERILGNAEKD